MTLKDNVQVYCRSSKPFVARVIPSKGRIRGRRPRIILGLGTRKRNSFVSLKAHRFMTRNKRRTVDL